MANTISNSDDIIDSRDVIARIDELESEIEAAYDEAVGDNPNAAPIVEWMETENNPLRDEIEELAALKSLAEDAEGYADDWQHGCTLIRDSYFEKYAEDLASDVSDYNPRKLAWPFTCIDWQKAARELQQDYTGVEFGGVDYWVR